MPRVVFEYNAAESEAADAFNQISAEIDASLDKAERRTEEYNRKRVASEKRATRELSDENKKQARAARQSARIQQRAWRDAAFFISDFVQVARSAEQFFGRITTSSIGAAAGLETYRATLQAVTRDAQVTEQVLGDLLKLTVDLVGIDTQDLIAYSARLQAAGLSAEQAAGAIEGVTKRVAEQGKSAAVTVRALEQFAQAINTDIISYRDFIPILRQVPTLYDDFSDSLGVTITSLDDLRAASEAVGGPRAAIIQTLQHMSQVARGADLNTLNAQLDIFHDSSRVLAAEIGSHLIPAVVFMFREINAGIQWFRSLSDEAQATIAWTAAIGTGFTALVGVLGSVSAALAFLNANLIATTGTGGLAGLAAFLAPAGPIAAGFGLATAAISPFLALLINAKVEIEKTAQAQLNLARQVNSTIQAIGNTDAVDRQILALQKYVAEQEKAIEQLATLENIRQAPGRARATFTQRGGFADVNDARERINLANRQIDLLSRLDSLQFASVDDLRETDRLLAQLLNEARQAGDRQGISQLQSAAKRITDAFAELDNAPIRIFTDAVPIRNFRTELLQLQPAVEQTQRALSNSATQQQVQANFSASIQAIRDLERVRLQAVDSEIQDAARPFIERQKLTTEERADTISVLQGLVAERLRIEQDTQAEITDITRTEYTRRSELIQAANQRRIELATTARTAEINSITGASEQAADYAKALSTIATVEHRRAAFDYTNELVSQGQAFEEARRQAVGFFRQVSALPSALSADAQFGRGFTSELRKDFEETTTQGEQLLAMLRQIANQAFALDLEERIGDIGVNEQEVDARIAAEARGQKDLLDIRQSAAEQGRQFVERFYRSQDREALRSLRQQTKYYRQFYGEVADVFIDLATGRERSFEQIATQFIRQSLRIVARAFIEHQIRLRLDDTLTAAKIANINKVAAAQSAAAGAGGVGNLASLGNLSGLGRLGGALSGGGGALGVSALLFPNEIKNLTGGISDTIGGLLKSVAAAPDRAFTPKQTVLLKIGDNEARDISDLQDEIRSEDRL